MSAPALGRAALARAGRLPGEAVAVLKALAVLGPGAEPARVAAVAAVRPSEARESIDALVGLDMLSGEAGVSFAHPMLQAGVYEDIGASERAALHAKAARVLIDAGGAPEEAAAHLLHADPAGDRALMEVLRKAARQAIANGEALAALPYLRRATAELSGELQPPELRLELARADEQCRWELGDGPAIRAEQSASGPWQHLGLDVSSLAGARGALEERGMLGAASDDEVRVDPERLAGLDLRLREPFG